MPRSADAYEMGRQGGGAVRADRGKVQELARRQVLETESVKERVNRARDGERRLRLAGWLAGWLGAREESPLIAAASHAPHSTKITFLIITIFTQDNRPAHTTSLAAPAHCLRRHSRAPSPTPPPLTTQFTIANGAPSSRRAARRRALSASRIVGPTLCRAQCRRMRAITFHFVRVQSINNHNYGSAFSACPTPKSSSWILFSSRPILTSRSANLSRTYQAVAVG